jgi:hypothetical protein
MILVVDSKQKGFLTKTAFIADGRFRCFGGLKVMESYGTEENVLLVE